MFETPEQYSYRRGFDAGHAAGWYEVLYSRPACEAPADTGAYGRGWRDGRAVGRADARDHLKSD